MNIQYQLSNGEWVDCEGERIEEFFKRMEIYNGIDPKGDMVPSFNESRTPDREEIIESLKSGKCLRNHDEDWYSKCRMKPELVKTIEVPEPKRVLNGQLWEECPRCGIEPVYLSLGGLCENCG